MFPKTVAAYKDECEAVRSWLSTDAWLNQHDFDRKSFEWKHSDRKATIHSYTGETIVPPMNGDLNLAILQEFMRDGMVEGRERGGVIEYRLTK